MWLTHLKKCIKIILTYKKYPYKARLYKNTDLECQKKHGVDENPVKAALLAKMQSTAQAAKKPLVRAVSDKETICQCC